jgi:hypothetical protein
VHLDGVVHEVNADMPAARFDTPKRECGERIEAEPLLHDRLRDTRVREDRVEDFAVANKWHG